MKSPIIVFILALLVACSCDISFFEYNQISQSANTSNLIFEEMEQQPCFPGGQKALLEYIEQNIRYPKELEETCVQGPVVVKLFIKSDGTISDAKVIKSLVPELDKDAIRVVMSMPKWIPGQMNGVAVDSWYCLPIKYKLK